MNKNIDKILISPETTIKEAMQRINEAPWNGQPSGMAIIVNKERVLLGLLTDGDIRRALIKDIKLDQKVSDIMGKEPIKVEEKLSPNVKLKLIKDQLNKAVADKRKKVKKIDKILIVDEANKVIGVQSFFEIWEKSDAMHQNVCIIGMGFVGLTLAVSLADIGFKVLGVDNNEDVLDVILSGDPHFHEKNLDYLLKRNLNKNLFVSKEITSDDNDIYVISVGTPVGENNEANLDSVKKVSSMIGQHIKEGDIVILRSTVPVTTCRNVVLPILEKESNLTCGVDFHLVFAPERTIEGKALEELKNLPQIIGGYSRECVDIASNFFRYLSPHIIAVESLEEAEMIKLVNNSFRDLSFAFANELVYICDNFNLDATKIIKDASEGYPRNKLPLPGFVGGYCLKKDPYIYAKSAQQKKVLSNLALISRKINEQLPYYVIEKILDFAQKFKKNSDNCKIFIIGFAFKGVPETSDMRNSCTLDIIELLRKNNFRNIHGFDPVVDGNDIEDLGVKLCSYEEGFVNTDIVIIMNNHPLYRQLDIVSLLEKANKNCLFIDSWAIFKPKEILKVDGIFYQGLGFIREKIDY
ncbi:MAG: nucleotide sugar dehydrogenase [Promethearchaeota archaeon]